MLSKRLFIAFLVVCSLLGTAVVPMAKASGHDLITVRGDFNYPPYEFLDGGVPTGFNVDIMRAVARTMHLQVKIDLGPWNEVRRQLEAGEIEALTGMYYSAERDKLVDFSTPHIIVNHSLFVREGSSITSLEDLDGLDVVVQQGDIMHDFALKNLPESSIFAVESQVDALKLLDSGVHDAALLGRLQNLYLAQEKGFGSVTTVGPPIEPRRYCIAVPEGREALLTTFNEGLKLIQISGEYQEIHDRWFGVYERQPFLKRFIRYALIASIPVFAVLAVAFIWMWGLRRAVRERTKELHESREHFRTAIEESPLGMVLMRSDGSIGLINREFVRVLGYTMDDISHVDQWWERAYPDPEYRAQAMKAWDERLRLGANGGSAALGQPQDWRVRCKDGSDRDIEFRAARIGDDLLVTFIDVTERNRTSQVLVQTEKMLSVGGLAAGMAHEINNPLGGILQAVQNITRRFSPDLEVNRKAADAVGCSMESLQEYVKHRRIDGMLQGIRESGERAAHIVANMLSFSRKSEKHHKPHDLNTIVERAVTLAESDYDLKHSYDFRKVAIVRDFADEKLMVECEENEIVQVTFNLLRNAAQALFDCFERNGGDQFSGRIVISTYLEGNSAVLVVADNGPGMDEETQRRVFEPFFTTKSPGMGTGLGLSVTYFIITGSHRGTISVESSPGEGAAFTISLPVESH